MMTRFVLILTFVAFAGLFVIPLDPVNTSLLKSAFLGCLLVAWIGFTILMWKCKPLMVVSLLLPLLVAIPFILPGGKIDAEELGKDYVRGLAEFEGTKYHWGGESSRGIDCSGLPRRAYRDALLSYGIRHLNGRALRGYVE